MSALPEDFLTPERYLEEERTAEIKREYLDGRAYDMAGATRQHNLIAGNVFAEFRAQLKGKPCETYISDMKVKVPSPRLYAYPDVAVACGDLLFDDRERDILLNPLVLVEVLSPSTEAYDRGLKFARYRQLESLQDYLLIAQDRLSVEHYHRNGGEWSFRAYDQLTDTVVLASIECSLTVEEIYSGVSFKEE